MSRARKPSAAEANRALARACKLLAAALTTADVDLIEINVDEPDVDAQRFYRRHGFRDTDGPDGDRAFYFHMELDASGDC